MAGLGLAVDEGRFERTAPFLKLSQIEEMAQEKQRLDSMMKAPPHISNQVQDRAQVYTTLKKIDKSLASDTATPYTGEQLDKAVAREKELREKFTAKMPTAAEMRRNPPGAVDKQLAFEEQCGKDVAEWKNIRRRLYVSGVLPSNVSERSMSNIELFRPVGGSGELPMDGAQIPQTKTFYGLGGRSTPFKEDELAVLKLLAPSVYEKLALMSADERDAVKEALANETQADPTPSRENFETLNIRGLRTLCKAEGLKGDGNIEALKDKLREHYAAKE